MGRTLRSLRIEAEDALIGKAVFRVMAARDWQLLIEIARIAQADADQRLAQTDPSRFRLLRDGVTNWHLKGLGGITPDSIRRALVNNGIPVPDMPAGTRRRADAAAAAP